MNYLLQFYEDATFGYKGIDDCENNRLLKQIDHGKVLFEQGKNEDRESFFNRVGTCPSNNQYGYNENLDKEINEGERYNRTEVAKQGYGLARLINDIASDVRSEVARQGYELRVLINDDYWSVREAVARHKYCLNKLINDENKYVREAVADQGYELDKLINDEESIVRIAVAKKAAELGREDLLEKLINDKDQRVRDEVNDIKYPEAKYKISINKIIDSLKNNYHDEVVVVKKPDDLDNNDQFDIRNIPVHFFVYSYTVDGGCDSGLNHLTYKEWLNGEDGEEIPMSMSHEIYESYELHADLSINGILNDVKNNIKPNYDVVIYSQISV